MNETIIDRRYRGPEDSGNGGYTCGLVAGFMDGPAEVTLRRPPPLGRPLRVVPAEGGVDLLDGSDLIAEGRKFATTIEVPSSPSIADSLAAKERYGGYSLHAFPTCFVCGTDRTDGLSIHPGQVKGRDVWASPFTPDESLPAADGVLDPVMVWSALDCPGAWAVEREARDRPVVLGRMGAVLQRPVPVEIEYVAIGWPVAAEGRKLTSGTALFDAGGNLYGWALQTWIVLAE